MDFSLVQAKLAIAHKPTVARQTGIPLRTIQRVAAGGVPLHATAQILEAWALRLKTPKAKAKSRRNRLHTEGG